MNVLGISCWYHDAAACLLTDGVIAAAAQEERFTRRKHDPSFPRRAIDYCLERGGIAAGDLDIVAFYDKPFLKFERLLETYLSYAPRGLPSFLAAMPVWLKEKLWIPDLVRKELGYQGRILFPEHHQSHAASAFFPSPFKRAAFLTTDGVGEWTTTSYGTGNGSRLCVESEIRFPHSLGLLYSSFTYFCGFRVNSGEYKLMGLAPYGEPTYAATIRNELLDLKPDGSFRLNMDYFTYGSGLRMTGRRFAQLFGGPPRAPESALTRREMDLARSVQVVLEEALLRMVDHVQRSTGETALCLAGGVALNCVANSRIQTFGGFDKVWIQPAAGDAGGALGAAYMAWYEYLEAPRREVLPDAMQGAYLGPEYSDAEIRAFLEAEAVPYEELDADTLCQRVSGLLAEQKIVGWFQGRMEYGPRALGARSILADPRGHRMQRRVNLKIKYRESFRPFAPCVPSEQARDYFALQTESPYMLYVAPVLDAAADRSAWGRSVESPVPAVTHVDGSARIQTVDRRVNPLLWQLLRAFQELTGCPVLVNTSFNVRGEPIVCSPADALACFLATHMDVLVLGSCVVLKSRLPDAASRILSAEQVAARHGLD